MKLRKFFGPFLVLLILVTGCALFLSSCSKGEKHAVQCIPNDDITELRIVSNDVVIQKIELLENDGVLYESKDPSTYTISTKGGSAYIAVYYLDHQGQQDFIKFEIVSSPRLSLVILQYNSEGDRTGVYAY